MDSSGPSANRSEQPPPHRWAEILGSLIAVAALTLPVVAIAHYSPNPWQGLPPATSALPQSGK